MCLQLSALLPESGCTHETVFLLCFKQLRLVSIPCNQNADQRKSRNVGTSLGEGSWTSEEMQNSMGWIRGSLG